MSHKLTQEQIAIIHHRNGPAHIQAVAGSGKTTTLALRLKYLIEERSVEPASILALSFSNAAVEALNKKIGEYGISPVTVHAFCYQLTRTHRGLTQEQTPEGTISYTYDDAGRRATMTVTGQTSVTYTYDNANRLIQITKGTDSTLFAYDDANRRTSTTLPNGVVMAYGYDSANHLTSITYTSGSTTIGDLSYMYDLSGRRVAVDGSLAAVSLPTAVVSSTVNANNQVTAWAALTLTYDVNGNLTGDGTNTYVWDERNQLSAISGGTTASFVYDAVGRRRSKTIGSSQTGFLYDGPNFVQELNGSTVSANLTTGGIDELFTRVDSAGARYPITDALGSALALTDGSGILQTQYSYEPYGHATTTGSSSTNSQKHTGREDDGTGLIFYRARYYNPQLGRFISEDPIGFASGPNQYQYANSNPISFRDPTGLFTLSVGLSINIQIGPWAAQVSAGVAADNQGGIGTYYYYGGGRGVGDEVSGGVSIAGSNAKTICDLQGPFNNFSVGGGDVLGGSVDGFVGSSANGPVAGGGVTLGGGLGAGGSATVTNTTVIPWR